MKSLRWVGISTPNPGMFVSEVEKNRRLVKTVENVPLAVIFQGLDLRTWWHFCVIYNILKIVGASPRADPPLIYFSAKILFFIKVMSLTSSLCLWASNYLSERSAFSNHRESSLEKQLRVASFRMMRLWKQHFLFGMQTRAFICKKNPNLFCGPQINWISSRAEDFSVVTFAFFLPVPINCTSLAILWE